MPPTDKVDQIVQNFATQLRAVIRDQLADEVRSAIDAALGGGTPKRGSAQGVKGNGAVKSTVPKRDAGGKRTPEEIEKVAAQLHGYIEKNPEQRAEQIAEATKLTTGELALPIRRLLASKKIKAKGKARGTTYTVVK